MNTKIIFFLNCIVFLNLSVHRISVFAQEKKDSLNQVSDFSTLLSSELLNLKGELKHISPCPQDDTWVSFESISEGLYNDLYLFNMREPVKNGENPFYLEPYPEIEKGVTVVAREINWCPVMLNDKKIWFAFVCSGTERNEDVFLGNTQDKNRFIKLTRHESPDYHPRWSYDGESLIYVSASTGEGDIYLIEDITDYIEDFDDWVSENNETIYDVSNEQTNHERLTVNPLSDSYPAWSHDNNYIAFTSTIMDGDGANQELCLIDMQDSDYPKIRLTKSKNLHEFLPSWSPNDSIIAFYQSALLDSQSDDIDASISVINLIEIKVPGKKRGTYKFNEVEQTKPLVKIKKKSAYYGPLWTDDSRYLFYLLDKSNEDLTTSLNLLDIYDGDPDGRDEILKSKKGVLFREVEYINPPGIPNARTVFIGSFSGYNYSIQMGIPKGTLFREAKQTDENPRSETRDEEEKNNKKTRWR